MSRGLIKDLGNGRVAIQQDQGPDRRISDNAIEERMLAPSAVRAVGWGVGDIRQSFLTEAQFQSENDNTWVLCDGRSVVGSAYEELTGQANIPDARGEFLRGADNGRGVDSGRNVGTTQNNSTALPNTPFTTGFSGSHAHDSGTHRNYASGYGSQGGGGIIRGLHQTIDAGGPGVKTDTQGSHNHSITGGGDAETRPRNVACNIFVKINR